MKISFIILGILGILVAISLINGCSYPTSYRAFIPKSLDSEYKEFERLCKEEIGKVVYARPVPKGTKLEDMLRLKTEMRIGDSIALIIGKVKIKHKEYYYFYVAGFIYYTNWTKKSFSMHDDSKKFIIYKPFLFGKNGKKERNMFDKKEREVIAKEESLTIKKMAFNNKELIGKEYEKIIFNPNRKWEVDMEEILRRATNFKAKESE